MIVQLAQTWTGEVKLHTNSPNHWNSLAGPTLPGGNLPEGPGWTGNPSTIVPGIEDYLSVGELDNLQVLSVFRFVVRSSCFRCYYRPTQVGRHVPFLYTRLKSYSRY